MKIGFDAKRFFNNNTGLGNYSRTLLKNILKVQPQNKYILYSPNKAQSSVSETYYMAKILLLNHPVNYFGESVVWFLT